MEQYIGTAYTERERMSKSEKLFIPQSQMYIYIYIPYIIPYVRLI